MPPATVLSNVSYTLFRLYGKGLSNTVMRDHPTLGRMRKIDKFKGPDFRYKVKFGNNQGIGSTLALAQAHAGSNSGVEFAATRKTRYGIVQIGGEAINAASGEGAIVDAVVDNTEAIGEELVDSLAFDLFRDGTGIRGRIKTITGNVIELQSAYDARNLKLGMTIGASTAATGLSPRVGSTYVTAIGEDDGKFTVNNVAGITGLAVNDYIFREGDPGTCMSGFAACTPITSPVLGVDLFRGVDRGVYPVMLAGTRVIDNSTDPEVLWGNAAVIVSTRSGKLREVITNPLTFHQVQKAQNAKVMYTNAGGKAEVGYEYISVTTGGGVLNIFSDPDAPIDRDHVCDPDQHYVRHLKGFPHVLNDDGNMSLRMTGDDGVEWRWRVWCEYIQQNPAKHAVVYRG